MLNGEDEEARRTGLLKRMQQPRKVCCIDDRVHGVHVMAYRQEESVAEIIDRSGVLAGRVPWYPRRDREPQRMDIEDEVTP